MRKDLTDLVIGVGGILRYHTRDTLGFAIKATCVKVNGEMTEIEKDPITDPGKKSLKGLLRLNNHLAGPPMFGYETLDQQTEEEEEGGLLETVYKDGVTLRRQTLSEVRSMVLGA